MSAMSLRKITKFANSPTQNTHLYNITVDLNAQKSDLPGAFDAVVLTPESCDSFCLFAGGLILNGK